ncbi:MAG: formylglycine-generating enzyme family protein [Cyanobacteria bacterium P01_F01_bin.53]
MVTSLSNLGLTGREIAEVIWLAAQKDEEGIIDVVVRPVSEEDAPRAEEQADRPQHVLPSVDQTQAPSRQPRQAEVVPSPVEQKPSLALPDNYKPIPVPDAPAITQALQLARSLRPLARQVAIGLPTLLDEEATVERVAETGVWQPVLTAEPELWLDVALVFDTSPSMCLWQRFGVDLHRLLARYGEFRDVRIWRLKHQANRVILTSRRDVPHKPSELLTGDRRRLIVVVSDCVAPAWHNGQMRDLISVWSAKLPTVIFQVFPERLWSRTALVRSVGVELQAKREGLPSDQLRPIARSVWDQERVQEDIKQPLVRLPVVTLEKAALSSWASMVAGDRKARSLGILWRDTQTASPSASQGTGTAPSLQERLDTFILQASPLARQLASLLVSAPVITLPIVRLIKQANLKQVNAVHIAEVFMSGLLKVSGDHTPTFDTAERVAYELVDDQVRDRLRAGTQVADAITVYRKVSEYIAQGLGRSVSEFWALLRVPSATERAPETAFLNAFASVTAKVLRGLGPEFETIADSLTEETQLRIEQPQDDDDWLSGLIHERITYEVAEYVDFPVLEEWDFIEARFSSEEASSTFPPALQSEDFLILTLESDTESEIPQDTYALEPFDVTVVTLTLELTATSSGRRWQREEHQQTAYRYFEDLSSEVSLEMVAIPEGHFIMGSPEDEPERSNNESPQHEVTVDSFSMGRYPVTQAQWRVVAAMEQVDRKLEANPARFKGDDRPVERVAWHDAVEFCARLSAHTNRQYRLPTEAEWEYACRAGTTTPFHFGAMITTEVANYNGSAYAGGPSGARRGETTPVDHFGIANGFGLSDMHGNVWEWCEDYWHNNYNGAPIDGRAWIEGGNANRRVRRGGSWSDIPRICRSACRYYNTPDFRLNLFGFRVVCSAPRILP